MKHLALPAILILTISALVGCGTKKSSSSAQPRSPREANATDHGGNHDGHGVQGHDETAEQTDMEKMRAALAKMDAEDAASAEKQHYCPVSGRMLGTMGAPKKVSVNGHTVWICCSGCEDKLLSDPDTYLAKLHPGH